MLPPNTASSSALISGREVNRKLPAFESLNPVKLLYKEPLLTFICVAYFDPWKMSLNEFLKVCLWEWVDMSFVYEIHYNAWSLKLEGMLQSMEPWKERSRIAVPLGICLSLCWLCEERQWVWPPHMLRHRVAQWISLASLSTSVLYWDSVFSGCSCIASGSNMLFLTWL